MTIIKRCDAYAVSYREPNDSDAERYLVLCRLESVDGVVGWGEAITQFEPSTRATLLLTRALGELVVGRHVEENVALSKALRDSTWWYSHRGGLASFAISAIDIALWDLKGRVTGLRVVDLLGGARRASLPVIASTHAFDADLNREVDKHAGYVAQGYRGVKIGMGKRGEARLGYDVDRDVAFARHLRQSMGPEAWLILDRGQSLRWDLKTAIERIRRLEEQDLLWIEEPFEPDEPGNFAKLRTQVGCMIGGGEREWDRHGYAAWVDPPLLDVLGCDPGRVGGITGALEIAKLAEDAGCWFNAHAWSSGIVSAASLALSAATSRCLLFEMKPLPNPMQDELITNPLVHRGGEIALPEGAGLGVEVDESVVEKYRLPEA